MKTYICSTSIANFAVSRKAIEFACLGLRKEARLSRKGVAKQLGISDYTLSHYEGLRVMPSQMLTKVLTIYNVTYDDFIDTACNLIDHNLKYCAIDKTASKSECSMDIYTYLFKGLRDIWEATTSISIEILNRWIKDTNIYYVYFLLVKQKFITQTQKNYVKERNLSTVDLWWIVYYDIPVNELDGVNNIPVWILLKQKDKYELRIDKDEIDELIKLICLA